MIDTSAKQLNDAVSRATAFQLDYVHDANLANELLETITANNPNVVCLIEVHAQENPDFPPHSWTVRVVQLNNGTPIGIGQSARYPLAVCEAYLQAHNRLRE